MRPKIAGGIYSLLVLSLIILLSVILIIKATGEQKFPLILTLLTGILILLSYWLVPPHQPADRSPKESAPHQPDILNNRWFKLFLAIILAWLLIINLSLYLDAWIAGLVSLGLLVLYFVLLETLRKI